MDAAIGVRPALLRDEGVTGNFDVSVKSLADAAAAAWENKREPTFRLVHSKKVPLRGLVQDGFVDDVEKLERILRAIETEGLVTKETVDGALAGRTALPRSITHPLGKRGGGASADAFINHWARSKVAPIVVFAKTWCDHCRRAVAALEKVGIRPFLVWMDRREDESEIQICLGRVLESAKSRGAKPRAEEVSEDEVSGVVTVPQVFRAGESLGGADDVDRMCYEGLLSDPNGEFFERWGEENGAANCWEWVEMMSTNSELTVGVEFYKFMGEMEGGMKVFRPPKRNDANKSKRPPF
jgi:glutaredoxin